MANKKSDTKQFLEECGFDPAEITDAHIDALDHAFIALEHDSIPPQQLSAEEEADRILAKAKSMGLLEEKDEAYLPPDAMADSSSDIPFYTPNYKASESVFTRRVPTYAMALAAVFSVLIGYGVRDLTQNDTAEFERYVMQDRMLMSSVKEKAELSDKDEVQLSPSMKKAITAHYAENLSKQNFGTPEDVRQQLIGKLLADEIPFSVDHRENLIYISVSIAHQSASIFKDIDLIKLKNEDSIVIEFTKP